MQQIIISLFLFFLISCSTKIDYKIPITRFDIPEVSGEFLKGSVEWNIAASQEVTLGEIWSTYLIFGTTHTTYDQQYFENSYNIADLTLELGVLPIIDIYTESHEDSTNSSGIKIQLWGESRKDNKEGLKAALKLGYGTGSDTANDTSTYYNSDNTQSSRVEGNVKLKSYDSALIVGYRKNANMIAYLNTFFYYYDVDATLIKDSTTTLTANGISRSYGALAGVRFGHKGHLSLEGGIVKSCYEDLKDTMGVLGTEIGYSW